MVIPAGGYSFARRYAVLGLSVCLSVYPDYTAMRLDRVAP